MRPFIYLSMLVVLTACGGEPAGAAILVQSSNTGTYTAKATLSAAATDADTAGKTVVVTSHLSAAMSNISSATVHSWPADRRLVVMKGGSINPTTKFTGLPEATPEMFGDNATPGTTNMTLALQRAVNAAALVTLAATTYLIDTVTLDTDTELKGAGIDKTILKQGTTTGASYGSIYAESGSSSTYISNLRISDMTIDGQVATKLFSEFEHLVSLNGVKDVLIERVKFLGFRGDGLYIGSGHAGTVERHNTNVAVQNSVFDGVNWDNRNGVSVIDGQGVTIDKNYFTNCSRATMPGAVDIEPDANTYHVIKGIKITNNTFINNKGGNGSIGFVFPDAAWTVQPTDLLVSGNTINNGTGNDAGIYFQHTGNATASRSHGLRVTDNAINGTVRGFRLFGVNGATFTDNHFNNTLWSPLIGYSDAGNKSMNITMEHNRFDTIGSDLTSGGAGVAIFTVDYLTLQNNTFVDCGKSNGTVGYCLDFDTGTSSYVSLIGNRYLDPGAKITSAVVKEAGHTFTTATNKSYREELVDCTGYGFQSTGNDSTFTYDTTTAPDSFPLGESQILINGDSALPSTYKQGIMITYKKDSTAPYRKFVIQWFYPANNDATTLADMYFRKAADATDTWSAWKKLTGS